MGVRSYFSEACRKVRTDTMTIYLGADHRGYELKEKIKEYLLNSKRSVVDLGNNKYDQADDYPDFAKLVAEKISTNPEDRGVLFCGSGVGMAVTANKFKGVRAGTVFSAKHVEMARADEDLNVIGISADLISYEDVKNIVDSFLNTSFSTEERHIRRVGKI